MRHFIILSFLIASVYSADDGPRSYSLTVTEGEKSFVVVWLLNFQDVVGVIETKKGEDVKDVIKMTSINGAIALNLKDRSVPHGTVIIYNNGKYADLSPEESQRIYKLTTSYTEEKVGNFSYSILSIVNKPRG